MKNKWMAFLLVLILTAQNRVPAMAEEQVETGIVFEENDDNAEMNAVYSDVFEVEEEPEEQDVIIELPEEQDAVIELPEAQDAVVELSDDQKTDGSPESQIRAADADGEESPEDPEVVTGSCGDNASYELSGGTLTITGTGSIKKSAFTGNQEILHLQIGEGITEIGPGAFVNCTSLQTVEFPEGLLKMGHRAFMGCTGLKEVTIPATLTECTKDYIGASGVTATWGNAPFEKSGIETAHITEGMTKVPAYLFDGAAELTLLVNAAFRTSVRKAAFWCLAPLRKC